MHAGHGACVWDATNCLIVRLGRLVQNLCGDTQAVSTRSITTALPGGGSWVTQIVDFVRGQRSESRSFPGGARKAWEAKRWLQSISKRHQFSVWIEIRPTTTGVGLWAAFPLPLAQPFYSWFG